MHRFLLHVLSLRFRNIRHYGIWGNTFYKKLSKLALLSNTK
ncbi:transposase [Paramaledivibacter caminithermalis]